MGGLSESFPFFRLKDAWKRCHMKSLGDGVSPENGAWSNGLGTELDKKIAKW